ncbi:unnamed protein product [Orchesella dallaii]|uniref:PAN2-PAN3 deadenylation complex catalytic subunit PAN2 n=1 Tax=Orchesella dallaii TaxID=48710 RepID=A0ABP1QXJ9_9HEXA
MLGVGRGLYYGPVESGNGPADSTQFEQVGEFQKTQSVLVDGGDRYGVSALTIDTSEELIWIGNQGGHVTSYYGANLEKYTSFQVVNNQEIRQILTFDDLILILSQTQLRGQIRRGIPVFTHASENFMDMQCMLQTSPTTVLFGGHQEYLVEYDVTQSMELRTAHVGESGCAILRNHGRYICVGQPSGHIQLLDPRTYVPEQAIEAHSGSLSDFDVHGNLLVTCGFSARHGNLSVDRFLKVYDLRVLRALAPIQISVDPFMLRFLPSFSSRIATVSPSGQMEISETQALTTSNIMLYQVTTSGSMCLAYDVSSSCHHMAFGDSAGYLHLFSSNPAAMFNSYSRETEFADPLPSLPPMNVTDEMACYASVALPLMHTPLLSEWPSEVLQPVYRKAPEVDRQILQSMKMVGTIGYAPNPGTYRRNQMQYKPNTGGQSHSIQSGMATSGTVSPFGHAKSFSPVPPYLSPNHLANNQGSYLYSGPGMKATVYTPKHHARPYYHGKFMIPKRYAKIDWKKSAFEESDMESFNRTQFSGLEAITANSYCNSMIQVLYHFEYLRGTLLNHLCKREACLSCELGFLFHMLDQSKSIPCSGSNFLRAFRVVPEASALGLILQESQSKKRSAFLRLIQSWNRFILHQIQTEVGKTEFDKKGSNGNSCRTTPNPIFPTADSVLKIFVMKQENTNRCTRCGREEKKESEVLLSNMSYSFAGGRHCEFVKILQKSISPEQTTPAWCDKCEKYQPTFQSRVPKALPPILSLNSCLDNSNDFLGWKNYMQSLLPDKSPPADISTEFPPKGQSPVAPPNVRSCRYGKNCMRPDCKFWHEGRQGPNKEGEPGKASEFDLNPEIQAKWLPKTIRIQIDESNQVSVSDIEEIAQMEDLNRDMVLKQRCADYELCGVVIFVRDAENEEKCNLVSIVHVDEPYFERAKQENNKSGWFLFNDFCVREVAESEAYSFNPKWKIPAVIFYRMKPLAAEFQRLETHQVITAEVFKEKEGIKNKKLAYKPLSPDELPKKGEPFCVAIDAEFVTLGQEETELRSDGKLATVKPQQLSVARVTCLRGQGQLEGTPFIDDYISTQEVVVDYLTKYSGIQPGDLDANFSSKYVTGLKSVYMKLRFLVDIGAKFVGHGLNNDFKVINLLVPQDQVLDTVNLFYLPNQRRMVSLKFLAWHFLGMIIQSETHDSVEDARTALALYRKYEELEKTGKLEEALIDLYEAGKKAQWQVPNECDKKVT